MLSLHDALPISTLLALAGLSADEGRNRFPNLPGVDVSALLSSPSTSTERDKRGHFFNYAVAHMWEPNSAKVVGPRPPGESIPDYSKIYDLEKKIGRASCRERVCKYV